MKIRPVWAELLNADGQTDMTKLKEAFRNFANTPKKCKENRRITKLKVNCNTKTATVRIGKTYIFS